VPLSQCPQRCTHHDFLEDPNDHFLSGATMIINMAPGLTPRNQVACHTTAHGTAHNLHRKVLSEERNTMQMFLEKNQWLKMQTKQLQLPQNNCNCKVIDHAVAPVFVNRRENGAHEWITEHEKKTDGIEKFSTLPDSTSQELNSDCEAKRNDTITLSWLKINVATTS